MGIWWYGVMGEGWRRNRQRQVLLELDDWRQEGRDLFARLIELTDDCDEVHQEALRIRRLLSL